MKLIMTEAAQEAEYSLELTSSEAGIIKTIAGRISGGGPGRETIDKLYEALADIESVDNTVIRFSGSFS